MGYLKVLKIWDISLFLIILIFCKTSFLNAGDLNTKSGNDGVIKRLLLNGL